MTASADVAMLGACRWADRRKAARDAREGRMLELTMFGLTGLAAMLVIVFCFTCADDFAPAREKSSFDLVNNAPLNNSQMMETRNLRFQETAVKRQENAAPASWLRTTSPAETGPAAIYSDCVPSGQGQEEVFHG